MTVLGKCQARADITGTDDNEEGALLLNTQMIGEKIRRARFARGKLWTQKKLAEQAGLSQGYISAIERGEEFPSLKALTKISEVLDWPLSFFIDPASSDGEAAAYLADGEADGAIVSPVLARDGQLRQALQTIVRAGLEPQPVVNQAQLEAVVNELRGRIRDLESRISTLEGPSAVVSEILPIQPTN